MSVVRRETQRRWLMVAAAVAVLCLVPVMARSLPVRDPSIPPAQLRDRILRSAAAPYLGYAESRGALGLPELPQMREVTALLSGTTRMRVWYASPRRWRVDVIGPTGERDVYRSERGTVTWDYEQNLAAEVIGEPPVRLPRAADLLPAELARRLLRTASGSDHLSRLGARRVAGRAAAGLRLAPSDPATTVRQVDIWADAASGLPLEVAVTGREGGHPVLVTRLLSVDQKRPPAATVALEPAPGVGVTTTSPQDLVTSVNAFAPYPLPPRLSGRDRARVPDLQGVGRYGAGFSAFAVLPLPGRLGYVSMERARAAGATRVELPGGEGMLIRTPTLTTLVAASGVDRRTFLLTGLVVPEVLRGAAGELLTPETAQ